MKYKWIYLLCLLLAATLQAREDAMLIPPLADFAPFVGRTWTGEFADSTPENPKIDIMQIERALNGRALRILHSINHGDYGGESILYWDTQKEQIVYYYFTTAGFMTQGVTRIEEGRMISVEDVSWPVAVTRGEMPLKRLAKEAAKP